MSAGVLQGEPDVCVFRPDPISVPKVSDQLGFSPSNPLRATDFLSKKQLRDHIGAYIKHWNAEPTPFIWTKPAAAIIQSHKANACAYLISGALGGIDEAETTRGASGAKSNEVSLSSS